VLGLVVVLSGLGDSDAGQLGHAIAVAFIATLYGVGSANVFYLPLASKLKQKSAEETALRELMIEGVLAVQSGDNPRIVREKLEAQLPPTRRSSAKAGQTEEQRSEQPAAAGA
jgi:chemotaxis protein MotA